MTKKYACSWMTVSQDQLHTLMIDMTAETIFFMKKNVAVNDNNDNDDCDESSYKTKSLLCLKIDDDVLNSLICENALYPSDTMIKEYFCSMFKASVICTISFTVRENACS